MNFHEQPRTAGGRFLSFVLIYALSVLAFAIVAESLRLLLRYL